MHPRRTLLLPALVALALAGCAQPQGAPAAATPAAAPVRDARTDWWREARCGLFLHWGLYPIPAEEW